MMNRKWFFFSSYEWKIILWCGLEKSLKDIFFDIFVEIFEFLEGFDMLYFFNDVEICFNFCYFFLEKLKGFEEVL